jgi:hypothetical protein
VSSKFSLLPVLSRQYGTLTDARTGKPRPEDFAVVLGVPVLIGIVTGLAGWRISIVGELISAIAIITGLLFGLVIFLFQLRLQLGAPDAATRVPRPVVDLIDQMFANVAYAIVVGFLTTAVTLIGAALREPGKVGVTAAPEPMSSLMTALVLALVAHFLLCLAMCLKRLVTAYSRLAGL